MNQVKIMIEPSDRWIRAISAGNNKVVRRDCGSNEIAFAVIPVRRIVELFDHLIRSHFILKLIVDMRALDKGIGKHPIQCVHMCAIGIFALAHAVC